MRGAQAKLRELEARDRGRGQALETFVDRLCDGPPPDLDEIRSIRRAMEACSPVTAGYCLRMGAEGTRQEGRGGDMRRAFAEVTGVFAGLAALVYLTGALALQLRLGVGGLPSSVAVPQLPREFLVGIGLLVVAPATGVGAIVTSVLRRRSPSRAVSSAAGLGAGLSCYLVIGALVVAKDPFPAKVCLTDGRQVSGVLIGETDSRTYLGDPQGARPRRVISIPQSHIERLVVGGSPAQLHAVRCDAPPRS